MRPSAQPPRQSSSLAGFSPPTELKRQVTLDMLDRLAGEALREVDVRRITSAQEPGRKVTKPQDTSSVAVTAKTMSPRDWIRNVARRAWHAFGVTGMDEIPVLNKQWTTRLNGEPALPELLLRPLARPTNNDRPSNRQVRDGPTPRQLSEAELDQPRVPVQTTSTGKEPTQAPLPVSGWTGEVESEWVSSEHIVPPAVAPSLPHLLPPQIVNEPAPALATMIARQASRQEATQVEVDLAQLATNIKRILDEEARRHGIDV
ncbi:MAG TPA: hypothetical protein VFR47_05655 [Anaerolineales bacterium]|nr:hypothetical protein [Anaerolineales bacterium]